MFGTLSIPKTKKSLAVWQDRIRTLFAHKIRIENRISIIDELFALALCRTAIHKKQFEYSYSALRSISIARAEYITNYNIFRKIYFPMSGANADNKVIRQKCFNGICARQRNSKPRCIIPPALGKANGVTSATQGACTLQHLF